MLRRTIFQGACSEIRRCCFQTSFPLTVKVPRTRTAAAIGTIAYPSRSEQSRCAFATPETQEVSLKLMKRRSRLCASDATPWRRERKARGRHLKLIEKSAIDVQFPRKRIRDNPICGNSPSAAFIRRAAASRKQCAATPAAYGATNATGKSARPAPFAPSVE